jgi:hypothetical protein
MLGWGASARGLVKENGLWHVSETGGGSVFRCRNVQTVWRGHALAAKWLEGGKPAAFDGGCAGGTITKSRFNILLAPRRGMQAFTLTV